MVAEIKAKVEKAGKALEAVGYVAEPVSAQEFHEYMTGEIFSDDSTTLDDVLGNECLMMHETAERSANSRRWEGTLTDGS